MIKRLFLLKNIIAALLLTANCITYAAVPDSIRKNLEDFKAVIHLAEHDYAPFKFKVTNKNKKEYNALKKRLVKDLTKGRRTWQDAVCAYVGWFGDFHFGVYGNDDITANYFKYTRKRIDYRELIEHYDPKMLSYKINKDTYLIRFPSCIGTQELAERFVQEYKASGCPNLIIDIRGNLGGQDESFEPLLKLLYDYPEGKRDGSVFRYTKASIERSEWTIEDLEDLGYPTDIEHAPEYVVKIADGSPLTFDTIYEYPKKAALIIDNMVASSGEQAVLNTRLASHRTTIYGRDNTMGCIDTGNCCVYESAHKPLIIQYPTTYSTRYEKGTTVDLTGIIPDVRITLPYPKRLTDNIDEWVLWVADDLKKQ